MFPDHPSRAWRERQFVDVRGVTPADPERFAELMRVSAFPRASSYDPAWVWGNHMGPVGLWLAEALSDVVELRPGMRVLDMGCGTALSSIFFAREFGVEVWAADLWIPPTDNWRRIVEAGVAERVHPLRVEAGELPFADGFFDALLSIDAYHYFGTTDTYLATYAPLARPGGTIAMVVPGDRADRDEYPTFHSARWWRRLWEESGLVTVDLADSIPDGWGLWMRFLEAGAAWAGEGTAADQPDAAMLLSDTNRNLGFTRVLATRVGAGGVADSQDAAGTGLR